VLAPASLAVAAVTAVPDLVPARDRSLPVDDALADLLPEAGLLRGRSIGCSGPAAWSLALALVSTAVRAGSWLAAVGTPTLGLEAAAEFGIPLSRVVLVDAGAGTPMWAERVAAAADGFELIVTSPPPGAERVVRKVRQRVQARGSVLVAIGLATPGIACDLELSTTSVAWEGIGQGTGHLMCRRATVQVAGRRAPRPAQRDLLLPGPGGRLA
jgi:hypothetical protein